MIGTNNTGHGKGAPPAETVQGIEKIVTEVKKHLPDTKIILHTIFPRGATNNDPLRLVNRRINSALPKLAQETDIRLLDINRLFLEKGGNLPRDVMPDLLHPNENGYRLWAEGLDPILSEYFENTIQTTPKPALSL